MALVRFRNGHPAADIFGFGDTFEKLFNDNFASPAIFGKDCPTCNVVVDVVEDEKGYTLKAEVPGIKKEEISVEVNDGVLVISGEKKEEKEEKNRVFHRVERRYGKFQRSFYLPDGVVADNITAAYKDGILELRIPKQEEAPKPEAKKIAIEEA